MPHANKLVSVITGTYDRHDLLIRAMQYVRAQTYENIEHCIVSDGPDPVLREWHAAGWPQVEGRHVPVKFIETGRQWSQFLASSISAVPFQVAQWLASGDYISWLADDEWYDEEHITRLVTLLEEKHVDFVYSKSNLYFNIPNVLMPSCTIGLATPQCGQVTQALYRAELLDYCGFRTHVGSGTDWDQVESWMKAGASWAFLDAVTHGHRVDKMGDKGLNNIRQLLFGNESVIR